jgi:hypothetical protein
MDTALICALLVNHGVNGAIYAEAQGMLCFRILIFWKQKMAKPNTALTKFVHMDVHVHSGFFFSIS